MRLYDYEKLGRLIDFEQAVKSKKAPQCAKCGEGSDPSFPAQIQLVDAFDANGPLFRCRICKHKYHHGKAFAP
jgi:hypothetical protein